MNEFAKDNGVVLIKSDDSGSIYQYTEEEKTFEVVEETVEDENGKSTIHTRVYDITNERTLIDEYVSTVESFDNEIIVTQDGDETIIGTDADDQIMFARASGGSSITMTRWTESGKNAYATIYPLNQKVTKPSNSTYKTFKSQANAIAAQERSFGAMGILLKRF